MTNGRKVPPRTAPRRQPFFRRASASPGRSAGRPLPPTRGNARARISSVVRPQSKRRVSRDARLGAEHGMAGHEYEEAAGGRRPHGRQGPYQYHQLRHSLARARADERAPGVCGLAACPAARDRSPGCFLAVAMSQGAWIVWGHPTPAIARERRRAASCGKLFGKSDNAHDSRARPAIEGRADSILQTASIARRISAVPMTTDQSIFHVQVQASVHGDRRVKSR